MIPLRSDKQNLFFFCTNSKHIEFLKRAKQKNTQKMNFTPNSKRLTEKFQKNYFDSKNLIKYSKDEKRVQYISILNTHYKGNMRDYP